MANNLDDSYVYAIHVASLISKMREKQPLSGEEQSQLNEWLQQDAEHRTLYEHLLDRKWLMADVMAMKAYNKGDAADLIFEELKLAPPRINNAGTFASSKRLFANPWPAVAAALCLLLVGAWLFFVQHSGSHPPLSLPGLTARQISPGGDKAILILADGTEIVLDSAGNGLLAQRDARIMNERGHVTYLAADRSDSVVYHSLFTPRGGQYRLTLPDGTKVWLNTASSIRFPTAFTGKERQVELSGEAYFEVIHNDAAPFKVKLRDQVVQDIGTHFNIDAYPDEPESRTTVLEGKVRLDYEGTHALLTSGHQGIARARQGIRVEQVDTSDVVSWKNGFFSFKDADIYTVMNHLSKWYDITVSYSTTDIQQHFTGKIDRGLPLVEVLQGLGLAKVQYRIGENHQVLIGP